MGERRRITLATPDDWKAACVAAATVLATGEGGDHVNRGEPWPYAIARVATEILTAEGKGRPKGEASRAWIELAYTVAGYPSTAADGLIQAWGGMRIPISALPAPERAT